MSYNKTMTHSILSTVTSKSQTVIPKEIRSRMGLRPGDLIRYLVRGNQVVIEKFSSVENYNSFAAFNEWASDADEQAFANLKPHV